MIKSKFLHIKVTDKFKKRLKKEAKKEQKGMSEYVRGLLEVLWSKKK